jgi:glycosyltransferase involved in cell wall biosynthesis
MGLKMDVLSNHLPSISIVVPTYNSSRLLYYCLESIRKQNYPASKIEILIGDGGSTDETISIAQQFEVDKILYNPLKTGEAGKAVCVKEAKNEIIALIDSDNILPTDDWLRRMVEPFKDRDIVGSEPLYYTYREKDGYITRYCALLGMNDPLNLFLGDYDRYSILTGKWTEVKVDVQDFGGYLKVKLFKRAIPTIGANGFLVRRSELLKCSVGDYLFDMDIVHELVKSGQDTFAKVKIGVVHLFGGRSMETFVRKQRRRIKDYLYYKSQNLREQHEGYINNLKVMKFILFTLLTFPLLTQSIRGLFKKKDVTVWLFHPIACWLTLAVYGTETIKGIIMGHKIEERSHWKG